MDNSGKVSVVNVTLLATGAGCLEMGLRLWEQLHAVIIMMMINVNTHIW